ncbi:MAG: serine/threonine protein phosphatase PrpC [Kiritimatiellia bacterium]|jgi:serine/threonine protein phosphatase PrpC
MNYYSHLKSAALTDIGQRRAANEDAVLALPDEGVFVVADGIGGSAGGAGSSSALVDAVGKLFVDLPEAGLVRTATGKSRLIRHNVNLVSKYIRAKSDELGFRHAGTTAIMLMFDAEHPEFAVTLHAGDSPAYRYRDNVMQQITRDHTYAAELPPEDVEKLPIRMRGIITRAVGVKKDVDLEETLVDVRPDDLFLLFSDGVTRMISDDIIAGLIEQHRSSGMEILARAIVDASNAAGGRDNISAVVIDVGVAIPLPEDDELNRQEATYLDDPCADTQRID